MPHGMHESTVAEALAARIKYLRQLTLNPPGGYTADRPRMGVVPVLHYGDDGKLARVELHPFVHEHDRMAMFGVPLAPPDAASAKRIIDHLAELSRPFGTKIAFDGKIGQLDLGGA